MHIVIMVIWMAVYNVKYKQHGKYQILINFSNAIYSYGGKKRYTKNKKKKNKTHNPTLYWASFLVEEKKKNTECSKNVSVTVNHQFLTYYYV